MIDLCWIFGNKMPSQCKIKILRRKLKDLKGKEETEERSKKMYDIRRQIKEEMKRVALSMESKINNLEWLNTVLKGTGNEEEINIQKARKALKDKVYINIYDLEEGKYHLACKNYYELKRYTISRNLYFPVKSIGDHKELKLFLKDFFHKKCNSSTY
jgi:hypothetical protein